METVKTWTLVRAILDQEPEDWSPLACVFEESGVVSTLIEENPPAMVGYIYEESTELLKDLERFGVLKVVTETIEEVNWAEEWKKHFKPIPIGQKLMIRPQWEPPTNSGRIEILIDPGMAFGTGDHPTTRMCLELLESFPPGLDVADIGCGSGILSIAAHKLGAKRIVAVDNDSVSVDVATENFELNQTDARLLLGSGFEALGGDTFDLVLSNIISATLIRVSPDAFRAVRPGGTWLISGVIQANWADVKAAAERVGFTLVKRQSDGEWVAATFRH